MVCQKYIRPVLNGETEFAVYLAGDGEQWQQEVISLLQDIGVCPEHGLTDHELLVRSRIYAVSGSDDASSSIYNAGKIRETLFGASCTGRGLSIRITLMRIA